MTIDDHTSNEALEAPADAGETGSVAVDDGPSNTETEAATPPADETADVDSVYDQAFAKFLDPKATGKPAREEAADDAEPGAEGEGDDRPSISDEQQQLLRRSHIDPDLLADWTDKQRSDFMATLAKREADTSRTYQQLKSRIAELEAASGQKPKADGQKETTEEDDPTPATPPNGELAAKSKQVVEELVETYGDEMKPLGDVLAAYETQLHAAQRQASSVPLMQELLVEMTIDAGIRDLTAEYPSLNKAEARKRVAERFEREWTHSPHRESEGSMLDRIKAAITDAAKAEFGTVTESAAQVALATKNQKRLANQPPTGNGRAGRAKPRTEDEIYDQAFDQFLKGS